MKNLFIILLFLTLQSCVAATNQAPHIEVQMDEFSREIEITNTTQLAFDEGISWQLRSLVNRDTGNSQHQVIVTRRYYSAINSHFNRASDDEATQLKVHKIARQGKACPQECQIIELFAIDLTEAALTRHAEKGYRIKVLSNIGEIIFEISPQYIQTQLATVAKYSQAKN